jgi:2,4-dienoyl-CoA reductase-like NADH-dependent reductase (Old Yellow Enzyme family)/radical SAM superfamily enzyme YgiQ (UPF0313 family)/nucleoside-diphosphate-sugar epimerase
LKNKLWNSPIKIGGIIIKNRIVYPPITGNWAESDGSPSQRTFQYYDEISKGGAGMIVIEGTAITQQGKGSSNSLCLYNNFQLEGFKKIASIMKKNSCFSSLQLMHVGGQGNPAFTESEVVSPSGGLCKATGFNSRELTKKEIQEIIQSFVHSASLAEQAGFDAVELHIAHGYLLHEFLSNYTNKRKDEYGGNLENNARIILEILQRIKEKSPKLIIGVRISGEDYLEDGINYEINKKLLPLLEKKGVDYFSVTAGIYDTSPLKHEAMKKGEFFNYTKKIKEVINKPVIGVGKILDLSQAEEHLKNKDCDLVAVGRAQLADPFLVQKSIDEKIFSKCIECNQCSYLRMKKKNVSCPFRQFTQPRKILILGGARFHGFQLAEHFAKIGEEVYVLNRGNFRKDYPFEVHHILADRNDKIALKKALEGYNFDIVIDNNGYNANQVNDLLEILQGKCRHYIFTSSAAVYLRVSSTNGLKEEEADGILKGFYSPDIKPYAVNKFLAEQAIQNSPYNINYTIVRFPNIFGEGDFARKLASLYERLKYHEKLFLEEENKGFSLIYVKDIARVFSKILGNERCFNKIINIADPRIYTYDNFFKTIYQDLYSENKIVLKKAEKIWEEKKSAPFAWGPVLDTHLSTKLLGEIDYTPIEIWGKKTLSSELETNKNTPVVSKKVMFIFCNPLDEPLSFPLGIGILSSILKKAGHTTKGLYVQIKKDDSIDFEWISSQIKEFKPDVICYSSSSALFKYIKKISEYIKENFNILGICGGVHPTIYPEEALAAKGIDYVCVGEGERVIKEFMEKTDWSKENLNIPGVWKLDSSGKIVKNRLYPLQNLNDVPWVDYEVFGKEFLDNLLEKNKGWLRYMRSRGCPYSCNYCHNKMIRKAYAEGIGCSVATLGFIRFKDPDLVIDEIQDLVNKHDIKVINFMDDLFCLNKENVLEFCRKFKERIPNQVGYSIQTHLNHLDEGIIQALRDSRCLRVVIGVESANERILGIFNRATPLSMMNKNLSLLIKAKFPLGVWTLNILGNPTETQEEMLDTLAFNARNLSDVCKFNFMAPYKDSDIFEFCKERNLLKEGYDQQKVSDRFVSIIKHNLKEEAFLEKFFDIGHWYMNLLAPLGIAEYYLPLIKEVENIKVGEWEKVKEAYLKRDAELSEFLSTQKKKHYSFRFKGEVVGKVIGLKKFDEND